MNDDINRTKDNFQAVTIQSSEPEMEAKPEKTGFGASHWRWWKWFGDPDSLEMAMEGACDRIDGGTPLRDDCIATSGNEPLPWRRGRCPNPATPHWPTISTPLPPAGTSLVGVRRSNRRWAWPSIHPSASRSLRRRPISRRLFFVVVVVVVVAVVAAVRCSTGFDWVLVQFGGF